MTSPKPLDLDFVQFILSRSDNFLVRYASLADVGAWRARCQQQLGDWQSLSDDAVRQKAIFEFTVLTFGAGRIPMLRQRFSSHKHRANRAYTPVDLSPNAIAGLKSIRHDYKLDSYSETVEWLLRELAISSKDALCRENTG